ncbi:MAG: dienelactone hydrolase family protein, partial [Patescibacteria group bacterium]
VVMIHEWWGLNDNIKTMARELAKEGYRVIAVDLFGKVAATSNEASTQVKTLDNKKALQNLQAAVAFLRSKGTEKIASLGWCFGGGQSLQFALSGEKLAATIIYYGNLVTNTNELGKISWPVLGIFGDKDQSIPVTSVEQFNKALDGLGIKNSIHIYPGVGHAFANPSGMNYAPEETKDAWVKTVAFLNENLKSTEKISDRALQEHSPTVSPQAEKAMTPVKKFSMTAYYDLELKKPIFSLPEITVKKGDRVRITVTNTRGTHDFMLDEFAVRQELPLNKEVIVEFAASKVGDFVYYCSKPGHRQNGQWGTLRIVE